MSDTKSDDGKVHLPVIGPVVDGPIRNDLDDALRFVHVMGMQVKHDLYEASSQLHALVEELMVRGQIDPAAFEARRQKIKLREQARQKRQAVVQIAEPVDKYTLKGAARDRLRVAHPDLQGPLLQALLRPVVPGSRRGRGRVGLRAAIHHSQAGEPDLRS